MLTSLEEMFVDFPVDIGETGFLVVYLTNQRVLSSLGSYCFSPSTSPGDRTQVFKRRKYHC